jgi:prophage DNA circulation protein
MTWRSKLGRVSVGEGDKRRELVGARFRGVKFFVDAVERTGGRRIVVHEFPGRDEPYVDDHGRRARTFPVEAYVIGADYLAERDALLEALEDHKGPGELLHPYHGRRKVICGAVSVRESSADGGIARFAIEFTEAPAQSVAAYVEADPAGKVKVSSTAAAVATSAALEEPFSITGLASYAIESAEIAVATAAEALGDALRPIVYETQELARLDSQIRLLVLDVSSLARAPLDALLGFAEVLAGLTVTIADSPGDVLDALVDAATVDLGAGVLETTAGRIQERANQVALHAAIRRTFAIEAARLAPDVTFDSHEEAIATRDALADLLDEQAAIADDTAYPALIQLRADLVRAIPGDAELARIVTIERRTAVPSLVLAYQLHGSVEGEADIISRNGIRHPGVISGTLRVLSDV